MNTVLFKTFYKIKYAVLVVNIVAVASTPTRSTSTNRLQGLHVRQPPSRRWGAKVVDPPPQPDLALEKMFDNARNPHLLRFCCTPSAESVFFMR